MEKMGTWVSLVLGLERRLKFRPTNSVMHARRFAEVNHTNMAGDWDSEVRAPFRVVNAAKK